MNRTHADGFFANISINPIYSISETAEKLSAALSIQLIKNTSGNFEEFEAYTGEAFGISVELISNPASRNIPYDLGAVLN